MIDLTLEAEALRQNLEVAPTMTATDAMIEETLKEIARRAYEEGFTASSETTLAENPYA